MVFAQRSLAGISHEPTTTQRGSFRERRYSRVYQLTGMQEGSTGDPAANRDRLQTVIDTAQAGDCILVSPGIYRIGDTILFRTAGITIKGTGVNREAVCFESTNELQATWFIEADNIHFYNFTRRVYSTARTAWGQSGEGNIWVQGDPTGFQMQDMLIWGSRDAAVFLYGAHNFRFNRVESRDSMSDAYHVTNGSSCGEWYDCISRNCGDDGIGFVGYGTEGVGTPHHHTVVRHFVDGQTWGRGFGIIHTNNISFYGPTLVYRSAGAGFIIAREAQYGSGSIYAIRIYGELRLQRSNWNADIDHGALHINNTDTTAAISDVVFDGPVIIADTGIDRSIMPSFNVRIGGTGPVSNITIKNLALYGTGPNLKVYADLSPGSSYTPIGWSPTSPYLSPEPPYDPSISFTP